MLDPDFEHLGFLNPTWPEETRKSYSALTAFAKDYEGRRDDSSGRKVEVAIGTYKYVPNWHGFSIDDPDDPRFYISTCSWREVPPRSGKRRIVGGENPYILVPSERSGPEIEAWLVATFNGWFDRAFNWSGRASPKKRPVGRKAVRRRPC